MDVNEYEGWVEKGTILNAGDVSPDYQVGEAFNRRFYHPDKPGRLMTVSFYGVRVPNSDLPEGFEYGIEKHTEYMICRDIEDPGSTEEWSEPAYDPIDGYTSLDTVEEAETEARKELEKLDAGDLVWNGEEF